MRVNWDAADLASLGPQLVRLALALGLLVAITVAVWTVAGVPRRWAVPQAVGRAVVQLAAISLVLRGVITSGRWVALALAVMFTVAATTAARRLAFSWRTLALVAGSMICGVLVAAGIVFATGLVEFSPRYLLAVGGIVIGNSMSISTLAGRRLFLDAGQRWPEVEGWLAVGANNRQAMQEIRRSAIHEALIPSLDQTRTVGLVTLPGAFVGALFGGASPIEAGIFQVTVLTAILAAGAIAASLLLYALAPTVTAPATEPLAGP